MLCTSRPVMRLSGGSAPSGVEHESVALDDEETTAIERWCEEIALRAKRAENADRIGEAVNG